jgi:hypothetical protein
LEVGRTHPKRVVQLTPRVQVINQTNNAHGCIQAALNMFIHQIRISPRPALPRRAKIGQAGKVIQQEGSMHKQLRMPASHIEDIPLSRKDGLEKRGVNAIRVDKIGNTAAPGVNIPRIARRELKLVLS